MILCFIFNSNPRKEENSMVKIKLKLSCALTEHHAMKAYWGVEV
jgi:hypothetical protein